MKLKNMVFGAGILLLSGCVSNLDKTHESALGGYTEKTIKEKLVVGKSTKRDVLLVLGAPMIPEDYNKNNVWVYASKTVDRAVVLLVPVVHDKNQILRVNFDSKNILSDLKYTDVQ